MSPDGLRGGGAGGEVGGRAVVEDRHPLDPPPHHGVEGVRSGAAELALRGEAQSNTRRRKMLRPVLFPFAQLTVREPGPTGIIAWKHEGLVVPVSGQWAA
jgi:hypothetical protein